MHTINQNPTVQCVSFDLWLTLIKPHSESGKARARILARALGVPSDEAFLAQVRAVSYELDRLSEQTGNNYSCADRIDLLCDRYGKSRITGPQMEFLVRQCQSSIRRYRPRLIQEDTAAVLRSLREQGFKLALVSNTGYPEAPVMRDILHDLGLDGLFDVMVFSSEVGVAKPAPSIFQIVCDALAIAPSALLHVGDSRTADYFGARSFGARSLWFVPGATPVEGEQVSSLEQVSGCAQVHESVARFPLYELAVQADGVVADRYGKPFSPDEYSRFKHGDAEVQRSYGYQLADMFIHRYGRELVRDPKQFVIAPFAFMHVPTAAGNMMEWFHERLGMFLAANRAPCVERFHIYKHVSKHSQDHLYATLPDADRKRILGETELSVDRNRLRGKIVVLIDDIFITGNSERKIYETVQGSAAREIVFLYVARMDGDVAQQDPGIEGRLNQSTVKSLDDLLPIFTPGRLRMNLCNCKFVLESAPAEVLHFVRQLHPEILRMLYVTCLDNSYYLEPRYVGTFACIENELHRTHGSFPKSENVFEAAQMQI